MMTSLFSLNEYSGFNGFLLNRQVDNREYISLTCFREKFFV